MKNEFEKLKETDPLKRKILVNLLEPISTAMLILGIILTFISIILLLGLTITKAHLVAAIIVTVVGLSLLICSFLVRNIWGTITENKDWLWEMFQ